ncbi:unnamed protein product [Euphydryas editha]|uniref:Uncharacterized protein n=1 Tax=Euphydryas editha TaxID=104508 RepID=A0AAU9V1J0_EUPED|nr:unnamed protein product [Euphydryas editha]
MKKCRSDRGQQPHQMSNASAQQGLVYPFMDSHKKPRFSEPIVPAILNTASGLGNGWIGSAKSIQQRLHTPIPAI